MIFVFVDLDLYLDCLACNCMMSFEWPFMFSQMDAFIQLTWHKWFLCFIFVYYLPVDETALLLAAAADGDGGDATAADDAGVDGVVTAVTEAGTDGDDSFVVGEFNVGVVVSGPRPNKMTQNRLIHFFTWTLLIFVL